MPSLRLQRPSFMGPRSGTARLQCPVDNWWFDARYTDGACPICGWKPDGVTYAAPMWLQVVQRADWELLGLVFMVIVLVVLGILVERAAGLSPNDIGNFLTGR